MPKSDATARSGLAPDPGAVIFRRMQPEDLDAVMIIEQVFATPWSRQMFEQELRAREMADNLVAEWRGAVVGYVLWWYVADEVHIVNIAVDELHRRRGIARRLLDLVFQRAGGRGMQVATLEVRSRNAAAIGLYESLGFRRVAVRKAYYQDNGEDALVMVKDLPTPPNGSRGEGEGGEPDG
jgi:ribosomal-protein-alanine N-acetyltransferase